MDFDKSTEEGRKYGLVHPLQSENAEMKKMADDAGFPRGAVSFDRKEKAYRVYEDLVPDDVDAAKLFAKYTAPEQVAKSKEESAVLEKGTDTLKQAAGTEVDEAKLYYPLKGEERDAFHAHAKESGAKFRYNKDAGAFQHLEGPTAGFERWQTPEAKAAWAEAGKEAGSRAARSERATAEGLDVMKERANGRHFVADNANGFFLPSKDKEAATHKSQLDALAKAPKEEVAEVYKITEAGKKALERKKYAMQINAAQKLDPSLTADKFNKMSEEDRRKASDFARLPGDDFKRLIGLTAGFFAARERMVELGLIQTKEAAKKMQAEADKGQQASDTSKSEGKSAPKGQKKPNAMAAALSQEAAAGMGR